MALPNFLCVGTAKAGTTSLYHYLKQHPEISIPVKETFYFMKDLLHFDLGYPQQRDASDLILDKETYLEQYRNIDTTAIGEIGTGYLYFHQQCIPLIRELLGDAKILIVLRNPVERAYSSYRHFTKDLHEPLGFRESCSREADRKAAGWDFMWYHLDLGFYANQVRAYLENFSQVKIIYYEDLSINPQQIMDELFDFLELPPIRVDLATRFNPSGEPKNRALQKFITHENPLKTLLRPAVRALMGKEKRERLRKGLKERNLTRGTSLPPADREWLCDLYLSDIEELSVLTGRDLSHWHRP